MLPEAPWNEEFIDAIRRSLSPGETLVATSQCYTELWRERLDAKSRTQYLFTGFDWEHLALTNANLRFIRFRQQKVKTGLLSFRVDLLPEIQSMQVVGIPQIVAIRVRQYQPERLPYKSLSKLFKCDVGPVAELRVTTAAGELMTSSPYTQFQALVDSLQSTITGATLASQSNSVADAVAKLAQLRDAGLLTDDEFERAKSGFVGRSIEVVESSATLIRQLAQLRDAGILSDAEFRIKKWDVLSRPG